MEHRLGRRKRNGVSGGNGTEAGRATRVFDDAADKKEQLYRAVFEFGLEGVFQSTPEGRLVVANETLAEMAGYHSVAEMTNAVTDLGKQLYVDPTRRAIFVQHLQEHGEVANFEAEIERVDGKRIWISVNARAVRNAAGEVSHYNGTVRDISPQKATEAALQQVNEKWTALVDSSGDSIVIATAAGAVVFSNRGERRVGIGRMGGSVYDGLTIASQDVLRTTMQSALQTGHALFCEVECPSPTARSMWFEMRVVPIGHVGAIENLILIGADVTMRRRAEEALRDSQRFIARVAETSPAMLYVYDLRKGTYVYANHQITKILGFSTGEFLQMGGSFAEKLIHPEDAELLAERGKRLASVEDGIVVECTLRMKNAAGDWLWIRAREAIFTRGADGEAEQIIGMAEDVTQRHSSRIELERSREQLRALSARLQEAREAEASVIARRVHDELGQTLTALNMDLCSMRNCISLRPAPNLDSISEKMTGMTELVASMLTTVRQLASELRPPILDQFGLLAAIQWQASEFQKRYGIQCTVTSRCRSHVDNQGVAIAIFRILQEILTNIARHAGATKVSIVLSENVADLMLTVKDDGCGITEGQQSASLGILGMRERALIFGGRVEISGSPGQGTTAWVSIPRAQATAAMMPRKETLLREGHRKTKKIAQRV